MSRRQERLEKKYRGTLLCDACNKHTEVPMDLYKKALELKQSLESKGHLFTYYCKRERCIRSRPEGLVPARNKRDR